MTGKRMIGWLVPLQEVRVIAHQLLCHPADRLDRLVVIQSVSTLVETDIRQTGSLEV